MEQPAWPPPAPPPSDAWPPPPMWSQAWPPAPPATPPMPLAPPPVVDAPAPPVVEAPVPVLPDPVPAAPAAPPAPSMPDLSGELLSLLESVTTMCDRVIEFVEADRAERHLMIEVLTKLSRSVTTPELIETVAADPFPTNGNGNGNGNGSGEKVVGGSMFTAAEPEVDLRERETAVEVRCRFGERWVDGFEIYEVLHNDLGVRYRLRRRIDGVVLPE